eukprot:990937_1
MDSYWRRSVRIKSPSPANAEEEYRSPTVLTMQTQLLPRSTNTTKESKAARLNRKRKSTIVGGAGGSEALSGKLAQIDEMRYAVLVMVYGHIVKHRLILLIIWNPMNVMAKKQLTVNATRERAHRC